MTTVGRFIPIYDAWSNEGGGRAIEEATRYSERKAIEELEAQVAAFNSPDRKRAWARIEERFADQRAAFVEKYGAEALNTGTSPRNAAGDGDQVDLSERAKSMIADLTALEQQRVSIERGRELGAKLRRSYEEMLEGLRVGYASRQDAYDARFEKDDEKRADAYERWQAGGARLVELREQSNAWRAEAAKRAGKLAAEWSNSASMVASVRLFDFQRDGSVKIDASALANMGTTEAATAELARLIGALAERNGLGQLRDALIGAINGQNRRIADRAGAAA